MPRRNFSNDFKRNAVNLVVVRGLSVPEACWELGMSESLLVHWIQEIKQIKKIKQIGLGHGVDEPDVAEVIQLRREVALT